MLKIIDCLPAGGRRSPAILEVIILNGEYICKFLILFGVIIICLAANMTISDLVGDGNFLPAIEKELEVIAGLVLFIAIDNFCNKK